MKSCCTAARRSWKSSCSPRRSMTWQEAADKARYLLSLFASSPAAQDPRRQMLIARVLEDFMRLSTSEET